MTEENSPALTLMLHVWRHRYNSVPFSWERGMQDALRLAITAGLTFEPSDFGVIMDKCRAYRWLDGEVMYAVAVSARNYSAAKAMEFCYDRPPFIADDVEGRLHGHGSMFRRKRERLAVGFTFSYHGYRPGVTSFRNDKVIACTYRPCVWEYEAERTVIEAATAMYDQADPQVGGQAELINAVAQLKNVQAHGNQQRKPHRRFTISREDIIADRADRKQREWMLVKGLEAWGDEAAKKFVEYLKVDSKSRAEFFQLPRKRIDAALKKCGLSVP